MLDFGAVARLPDGALPDAMGRLIRVAAQADHETLVAGLRAEGFIKPNVSVDPELVLAYLAPFIEPTRTERFQFTREWMRGQFERINNPRDPAFTVATKLNLPTSYLLIHRTWLGGIGLLSQLQAQAPFRAILEGYSCRVSPKTDHDRAPGACQDCLHGHRNRSRPLARARRGWRPGRLERPHRRKMPSSAVRQCTLLKRVGTPSSVISPPHSRCWGRTWSMNANGSARTPRCFVRTEVAGLEVHGADFITWNDEGQILDFTVMIRPLKALNAVIEQMGAELLRMLEAAGY